MTCPADLIDQGLVELGLDPSARIVDTCSRYIDLLGRWNRTYNLTALNDPLDMAVNHVLDSLSVASWLRDLDAGSRVVDVGSGAGLPGVPLAIYFPQFHFVLLDSNGKKTRFLTQAKIDLGLDNVEVYKGRAEDCGEQFDGVICRAFASLADISKAAAHLLKPGARLLAMKGRLSDEELSDDLQGQLAINGVEAVKVPFLDADRQIVLMEKEA